MRLIYEPSVYLIGTQRVDDAELLRFLDEQVGAAWTTDAPSDGEALAEAAGRLCYMSFAKPRPGGNAGYLAHILDVAHGSVLEHAVYTLLIAGVSRSCSHELVRHRHLSPSQLSQRYVDESDCAFVVPPALADAVRKARDYVFGPPPWPDSPAEVRAGIAWHVAMEHAMKAYNGLVDHLLARDQPGRGTADEKTAARKAAREAARSVLPNAVETRMCLTGNARAWRGFLDQRARPEADAEIRRLALAIHAKLAAVSPNLFGDYQSDPAGGLTTPHRKV